MTAKEMFEELGYDLIKHKTYMFYHKVLVEEPHELDLYHIEFNFENKTISKSFGDDNTVADITIEEFKAIQKQIEELGW